MVTLDVASSTEYCMGAAVLTSVALPGAGMTSDGFTRVVLVLILGCLVALVAREFAPEDPSHRAAMRGRYSVTVVRHGGDLAVLRTDTHDGVVSRTFIRRGGPWEALGEEGDEEVPPEPAAPGGNVKVPPEPAAPGGNVEAPPEPAAP
jgi:hypothetical protein